MTTTEPLLYRPLTFRCPPRVLQVPSAWKNLELILGDILDRFDVGRRVAIEFGVEKGFSTVALSNFFDEVIGVDTFEGDITTPYTTITGTSYAEAARNLEPFENIRLLRMGYESYIRQPGIWPDSINLVHVDVEHLYESTFDCLAWAVMRAEVVLVHDTLAFEGVRRACAEITMRPGLAGLKWWEYPKHHGLGILTRKEIRE